ncbi:polysaccharide pyruvyl transferase family protein [Anabaena cylindrica UHCC 0172]|uniref:polysaccharide pyruvyl transferase family protein n=1 Tax=Anabaena cylindrica TaxID=1165 RepID=UPI002B2099AF|nr:polysaccharide pyruvyl transferase family protein [Anabaena cylindrica]MEA5553231.1 polysaccharide pyruvyl transferase family protein [Anabaena cylindrica UHCC 0172]
MKNTTPQLIKEELHKALGQLDSFESCALLNYPDYLNLGDHLIWLGTVMYLTDVLKTKIKYASSIADFSPTVMEEKIGKAPIFLQGGGNLGDIWRVDQQFREQIIAKYQDRPVIILPQSVFFSKPNNLQKTANIFNSHPNLTIFVRDDRSYQIAQESFHKCRVIKSPDMAFQLLNLPGVSTNCKSKSSILFLCRKDKELNQEFSVNNVKIPNLVVEDWVSFPWVLGLRSQMVKRFATQMFREVWQRGLMTPLEWIYRQKWQSSYSNADKFNQMYNPFIHKLLWNFMSSGIYQFQQHQLVITNRLHGHILCILLGIPHVFLPNAYYKNESFYEAWTKDIPFCRFVKNTTQIESAVQELLEISKSGKLNV